MHDSDNGSGIHSSRAATATTAAELATGVRTHICEAVMVAAGETATELQQQLQWHQWH